MAQDDNEVKLQGRVAQRARGLQEMDFENIKVIDTLWRSGVSKECAVLRSLMQLLRHQPGGYSKDILSGSVARTRR